MKLVPTFSKKEQFPFPPGSQVHGTTVCDALPPHSRPRPILPVAKRVRFGDDIPPHAPLASPVRDPGSSVRMPQNAPPSVPSTPTPFRCNHHRYVDCAVGATCTASRGMAHAAQPVSLAHAHNSTRLRDSVRQATSQVQRRSRDVGGSPERPCLARGDCCPPGKGCNRAGPSSRDEAGVLQPLLHRTQERWWPSANPGSASLEPGFAQATNNKVINLPAVSPLPQPLDRPCLSTGRGAPRTSVPAYCCHNRCLQHGLGRYMQWAGSLGALDRAPTALAHQLPGAVGSAFSLAAVPATAVGQARASPHGQHCGGLIYQPAGEYTITPHVTAHPPSPPLESHAVQVTACCSHPGAAQSCGRRALTTAQNGDSIPRRSGWSGVDSGKLR